MSAITAETSEKTALLEPQCERSIALLKSGANPHEVRDIADIALIGPGGAAKGPLTAEQREALKRERDRVVREQLPAKDAALQEECRELQTEAEREEAVHIELLALLAEGVVEAPCHWPAHAPWAWWNEGGRLVCGVCHPRADRAVREKCGPA
jgi:hypothetical protein